MRISESKIRRIIREEAQRILGEGFDGETGLPNDARGVVSKLQEVMPKLAKSGDITKQEYWTVFMVVQLALHNSGLIENAARELVRNTPSISKHLGLDDKQDKDNEDPNRSVRDDYRKQVNQGIASGRKDWSNFPGPGEDG